MREDNYIAIMTFEAMEQLVAGYADIPNYTDIEPVIQLTKIIEI